MNASIAVTLFVVVTGFLYLLLWQKLSGHNFTLKKGHSTKIPTGKDEQKGDLVDSKVDSCTPSLTANSMSAPQVTDDAPRLKSTQSYSFRVSDVPNSILEPELRRFLEELGPTDGAKRDGGNVLFLSLAKSCSGSDSTRYQVATVTFRQVPEILLSSISQSDTVSASISTCGKSAEVNFDSHFLGLTPLFSAQNPTVDIIAVTGLAGHAFGSWKARGGVKMWLRDFLAEDLSQDGHQIRILTYGYDSTLVGSASDASVHEFARRLLETVKDSRCQPNEEHRPIIFIAKGLGGLVLKHALTEAAQGDSRDMAIFQSCYAALFFGVPNRGLLNSHLVSMVRGQPNAQLVRDLGEKSQFLPQIHREFQRRFLFEDAKIYSFYESKDTRSVVYNQSTMRYERTGPLVRMVTRDSATYSGPNEKIYQQLNIDADHSDIVKFGSRSNFDYMTVRSKIRECVEEAPRAIEGRFPDQREKTPEEKQCLRSLLPASYNPTPQTPRVRLHPGTCEWLLGHETFNQWRLSRKQDSRFLWINGTPGTGKTVLMNFLREQLTTDSKLRIAYFFCDSKDANNRTAVAVLKSLLYQLLDKNPGFFQHILQAYEKFRLDKETNWSAAALWDAFNKIAIDPAAESVYCIVDALDECLDDQSGNDYRRSDLLRDLNNLYLSQSSRCTSRIVLSSRPIPQIESLLPNITTVIRLEDFNRSDIDRYISDEVDRLAIKGKYPPSLKKLVQDRIKKMSGNMFLWVSLVMNELSKCRTKGEIRHLLNTIPRTLFAYYESVLANISSENSNRTKILLMWIVHAATPIRLEELALAIAVRADARSIADIEDDIPLSIEDDVMELCSPLVEIVDSYIVLIHQTVKDFLITASESVGADIPPFEPCYHRIYYVSLQEASSTLARTCITYLMFIDHLKRSPIVDILKYPVVSWPIHARLSAPLDDNTKDVFRKFMDMKSTHFSEWVKHYWKLLFSDETYDGGIQTHIKPLYVASLLHITPLVELLLEDGAHVNSEGGKYFHALQCAASNGGSIDVVKLLVRKGADVNGYGGFHGTALMAASFSGNLEVVRFLLGCGAKTDIVGGKFGDVLQAAAWRGNLDIVKLLLSSGASTNVVGGEFGNPLLAAAWSGHLGVVEFLLDQGMDANSRGRFNGFPLQAAVRRGMTDVIETLLQRGADVNLKGGVHGSALHAAILVGNTKLVQVLVDAGADINSPTQKHGPPLHVAVHRGLNKAARTLVAAGASTTALNIKNQTPLDIATEKRNASMISFLRGVNTEKRGHNIEDNGAI